MQKVFLYGYWAHNLGDDLFLKIFMEHYPETEVCLMTKKKYAEYYNDDRITCVLDDRFFYRIFNKLCKILFGKGLIFLGKVQKADYAVILGGSLFMEYHNWENKIARVMRNYVTAAPKCYVLGSNFGPYTSKKFTDTFHEIFKQMEGVCFRDTYSAGLFADLENVRYTPDIVFNLSKAAKEAKPLYENYYVISVIEPENRIGLQGYGEVYEKAMVSMAEKLAESGSKIIIMSVCSRLGDDRMAERVRKELKAQSIDAIHYAYDNLEETLALLAGTKGIVATHFHTMILAFVYNVPVFPVIYNIKMEHVLGDYGFTGDTCCVEELGEWKAERVLEALAHTPDIPQQVFEDAKNIFADIDGHL